MQTWLSVHVYTGIGEALLALIHTGHKYNSPLGIALTATMMLVVVSGFAIRYLLAYVTVDMKAKLALLQTARGDLDSAWGVVEIPAASTRNGSPKAPTLATGWNSVGLSIASDGPAARVMSLAEGVADLEYSIRIDNLLKLWFSRALTFHIVLSVSLLALLAAHITSEIYFGLRWLQ